MIPLKLTVKNFLCYRDNVPTLDLEGIHLEMSNNGDGGLKRLALQPRLIYLGLEKTQITNAGLSELSKFPTLETVNLSRTKISDAGLVHLESLKNLKNIVLERTPSVTDAGIARLKQTFPDLEVRK